MLPQVIIIAKGIIIIPIIVNEEELSKLGEETRALILDKGIKQHQYYVYDASGIENVEKAGSPALLSDVLSFLRRG